MSRVLLASRNAKKLAELRRVVEAAGLAGLEVVGLDDVPAFPEEAETGATFEENALIKAHAGARATGLPCIADDSGLAVDALRGMPGVLSARWTGRHGDDAANNALLLGQLGDVPAARRGAAFVSACALGPEIPRYRTAPGAHRCRRTSGSEYGSAVTRVKTASAPRQGPIGLAP